MIWLNGYRTRLVLFGTIVSVFWSMTSICSSVEYIWMNKADMPTPRWDLSSAVVNGKIYAIGGVSSEYGSKLLSNVEEYDPATNTWTNKADMPTARWGTSQSSAVVDGRIYVIGGGDSMAQGLQIVEEYNPATDTWTRKADMPTPRWDLSSAVVDGKIYAIGGAPGSYTGLNVVEQYDPTTDTWTRKADMPLGVWGLCACVVNGKIYAFGGRPATTAIPNMYEYDPANDTWRRRRDMFLATSNMSSVVLDNKIYVIGGWQISTRFPYTTVQLYEPETDIWIQEADVPFGRALFSADVLNSRIYTIGGTDRPHPCPATSTVYEFGPLLDFNWDGIVDSSDMCKLIDHWQTDNPLYDIAPLPYGDGIVDVQDLIELSEHLFEEILPAELIGHWKLDEDEGDIAHNNIGGNHGMLSGNPTWQPNIGQVAGALELDGIDDYVSTEPVLNPAEGPFSVLAWVKGEAPGQSIVSQAGAVNWLCTDSVEGFLTTELKGGRGAAALLTQTAITDGTWHRIGFVWDGSYRHLYVDGVEVATDALPLSGLENAGGGLYFGAGSTLAPDSFFSGLIDDIRIYNRVVSL
jgi:N-acetylneuraminic acid mutarotase